MNKTIDRPAQWQLPPGVTRGVWDYTRSEPVADDYDNYFSEHALFDIDQPLVDRYFPQHINQPVIADFGCGTGRTLIPLVQRGSIGLAIDLSDHMLRIVQCKADMLDLTIHAVRANLVNLDCLHDEIVDFAVCMFSTLGMIRGAEHRRAALGHFFRILKPGASLVLHVHNYWFHLFDPGGIRWVAVDLIRNMWRTDTQLGDKYCDYRGVPKVYLHSFQKRELRHLIEHSGFEITEWQPLNTTQAKPLPRPRWLEGIRASGWLLVVKKPQ